MCSFWDKYTTGSSNKDSRYLILPCASRNSHGFWKAHLVRTIKRSSKNVSCQIFYCYYVCFLPPVILAGTFPAKVPPQREDFNQFDFVVNSRMIFVPYVLCYHQNYYISPSSLVNKKTTWAGSSLRRKKHAALFLLLGLPSTLTRRENEAFQKHSSNWRNLKTPALLFRGDGKHFWKRCRDSELVSFKHKCKTDCWVFILLRCSVDGIHLIRFQSETSVFQF